MISHQRRHPRDEAVQLRVVVKPVPENGLGLLGLKRKVAVAAARGDEVHLVFTLMEFPARVGGLAENTVPHARIVQGDGVPTEVGTPSETCYHHERA
jgi:hypothetical protein